MGCCTKGASGCARPAALSCKIGDCPRGVDTPPDALHHDAQYEYHHRAACQTDSFSLFLCSLSWGMLHLGVNRLRRGLLARLLKTLDVAFHPRQRFEPPKRALAPPAPLCE